MPKVSIFKNIADIYNPENVELQQYLEWTRDGKWKELVNKCRSILDKEERNAFKDTMPTTCLSGVFSKRSNDGLVTHSGYINIDLDHVENIEVIKRKLENDKHVYSVFKSVSGDGLRVLFSIEPMKHQLAFKSICQYIFEEYGEVCDPNNFISKPFLVSHDTELFFNFEEVVVFKKYIKETPIKNIPEYIHTANDFDSVVKQIVGRGVNICDNYNDWLRVGMAIADHFGIEGEYYFHEISRMSSKYRQAACSKQYSYCVRARGLEKARISTVYYLAKESGIKISTEQTKAIIRTTRNGKKAGLKPSQIIDNLKKHSSIEGADELVKNVFDSDEKYVEEDEQSILPQTEMFIENSYNLKMNEVTGYLEQNGVQLSPADLNSIFISAKKMVPKLDYQLLIRLLKSDFIETYNPFYKFFDSDGIPTELPAIPVKGQNDKFESPLIDNLARTIKNNNPAYTRTFLRKWIVSIISAMHKVHSPLLFCLLGAQNSGKTEWFRRLLPKELQMYYAESKLDKEKDDELLMTENILVMDDELGGKTKQDTLKLNNITSKQWFSLRRPYGDHNEKILRLAVLCGTSNYLGVLTDPTGNRRIIPIDVIDIDKELYNSIDKKDLFTEAYNLYRSGFDWRITKDDIPYLNEDQVKYETVVKEREIIQRYFAPNDVERMTSTDILIELDDLTRQKLNLNTIGRELTKLGFERKTTRIGNSTPKMWCVERINRGGSFGDFGQPKQGDLAAPF